MRRLDPALRLNTHFHLLALDGVYYDPEEHGGQSGQGKYGQCDRQENAQAGTHSKPRYLHLPDPTDGEVEELVQKVAHRVHRFLVRKGALTDDGFLAGSEDNCDESELLRRYQAAAVQGKIEHGKNVGFSAQRLYPDPLLPFPSQETGGNGYGRKVRKVRRCADHAGYSLHCGRLGLRS